VRHFWGPKWQSGSNINLALFALRSRTNECGAIVGASNKSATRSLSSTQTAVVSSAAIAAILVEESRSAYYATGRPCACPEDLMRNGRRCGGNSAGGASPYCYVSDVPLSLIQRYLLAYLKTSSSPACARAFDAAPVGGGADNSR
jgi:hypothetical protein